MSSHQPYVVIFKGAIYMPLSWRISSVLVEVMALEVIVWGIVVLIIVEVRVMISLPIVGVLLDTVCVMMLSEMLRVMLALVLVRVVMAHVVGAFGLNVMILTVLFG